METSVGCNCLVACCFAQFKANLMTCFSKSIQKKELKENVFVTAVLLCQIGMFLFFSCVWHCWCHHWFLLRWVPMLRVSSLHLHTQARVRWGSLPTSSPAPPCLWPRRRNPSGSCTQRPTSSTLRACGQIPPPSASGTRRSKVSFVIADVLFTWGSRELLHARQDPKWMWVQVPKGIQVWFHLAVVSRCHSLFFSSCFLATLLSP